MAPSVPGCLGPRTASREPDERSSRWTRDASCPADRRAHDHMTVIAFEALAVATIAPRVARDLGGLDLYGWLFSAFMLANLVGIVRRRPRGRPARARAALSSSGSCCSRPGSLAVRARRRRCRSSCSAGPSRASARARSLRSAYVADRPRVRRVGAAAPVRAPVDRVGDPRPRRARPSAASSPSSSVGGSCSSGSPALPVVAAVLVLPRDPRRPLGPGDRARRRRCRSGPRCCLAAGAGAHRRWPRRRTRWSSSPCS